MNQKQQPVNNSQVAAHLNDAGAAINKQTAFEAQVKEWFRTNGTRLHNLCGSKEMANRMLIAALNTIQKVPSIMECTQISFTNCLLQCAEYNLMPGFTGECSIVPFNNKGVKEATFVLGYFGVCQLLYRSGMIKDIEAAVVCADDYFSYKRGSNRSLEFEPAPGDLNERGEWVGVYCVIRNIFGGEHIMYMSAKEVLNIKKRSKASGSSYSPWNSEHPSDVAWMWMKTALKQNSKMAPKSTKAMVIHAAIAADESNDDAPAPLKLPSSLTSSAPAAPAQAALPEGDNRNIIEIPKGEKVAEPLSREG